MDDITRVLCEDQFPGNTAAFTELTTFMKSGSVVGFTGAGVGSPLFPTWIALLTDLLEETVSRGLVTDQDTIAEWKEQIKTDPLELASTLEGCFSRPIFRAKFARIFENADGACTKTHDLLIQLNFRGIVTLNYDDGLEVACAKRHAKKANSGRSQDEATLTRWLHGDNLNLANPPILHFHGDVSDPEKMVLTADDYDRFYQSSLPDTFIKQLWRSYRLLVVGFGFSDPFLTRVAESTLRSLPSDTRHFAFIGRSEEKAVSAYQRQQFGKKFRLIPVFYPVHQIRAANGSTHSDHSKLLDLLQHLPKADPASSISVVSDGRSATITIDSSAEKATVPVVLSTAQAARADFERDLFMSPHGRQLYVEPKFNSYHEAGAEDSRRKENHEPNCGCSKF